METFLHWEKIQSDTEGERKVRGKDASCRIRKVRRKISSRKEREKKINIMQKAILQLENEKRYNETFIIKFSSNFLSIFICCNVEGKLIKIIRKLFPIWNSLNTKTIKESSPAF